MILAPPYLYEAAQMLYIIPGILISANAILQYPHLTSSLTKYSYSEYDHKAMPTNSHTKVL